MAQGSSSVGIPGVWLMEVSVDEERVHSGLASWHHGSSW
ncbi:hypothetical protein AM1_F0029 (plasmid) [Acaryochloris marina MBIC11017]|uniref:Uncharacterized protein n=1 Tax=Acaryochloris marina (strain MBIC 11017) TaxID=329726 RepID=A8ZQ12_ACAM1|nr:hypothetical protein AM1_F0029 [Acaryochloris marina MBIC11017]